MNNAHRRKSIEIIWLNRERSRIVPGLSKTARRDSRGGLFVVLEFESLSPEGHHDCGCCFQNLTSQHEKTIKKNQSESLKWDSQVLFFPSAEFGLCIFSVHFGMIQPTKNQRNHPSPICPVYITISILMNLLVHKKKKHHFNQRNP